MQLRSATHLGNLRNNSAQGIMGTEQRLLVTSRTPQIIKYTGRINGICPDVNTFLQTLDYHIKASNIPPEHCLEEAKGYLDLTQGDISSYTASYKFKEIKSYEEFKEYLREVYGKDGQLDPVVALSQLHRRFRESNKNYIDLAGEAYNRYTDWQLAIANSDWVQDGNIKVEDLVKLLHQATILTHLPERLVLSMNGNWNKDHDIATIHRRVEDKIGTLPNLDMSTINGTRQTNTHNRHIATVTEKTTMPTNPHTHQNLLPSSQLLCQNCGKRNHYTRDCFAKPFCTIHQSSTHSLGQCRSHHRNQQFTPRLPNRSYHQKRNRSKSPFRPTSPYSINRDTTYTHTNRNKFARRNFQQGRNQQNHT